jgi:hypothetical protein
MGICDDNKQGNIFMHVLSRLGVIIAVGFLSYIIILDGRADSMGYGMAYTLLFTAVFTFAFGIIDSTLLFVRKKRQQFRANLFIFGLLTFLIIWIGSFEFI